MCDSPSSPASKKRKRASSLAQAASYPTALDANGKLKPRRIDPDRLATRLGADLTADLDKFLFPGAKMPSFAVRQELVKKYSVDRRHIYDYLHSRGLRVAKEDRHLNLSRKAAAAASRKKVGKENIPPPAQSSAPSALATLPTVAPKRPAKRRKTITITLPAVETSASPPSRLPSPQFEPELTQSPLPWASCEPELTPDADELVPLDEYCEISSEHDVPPYHESADAAYIHPPLDAMTAEEDSFYALDTFFDFEDAAPAAVADVSPHARFVSMHDICAFSEEDRTSFYNTVNASVNVDPLARHDPAASASTPSLNYSYHYDHRTVASTSGLPMPVSIPISVRAQPTSMKHKENIHPAVPYNNSQQGVHAQVAQTNRAVVPALPRYQANPQYLTQQRPLVWTPPVMGPSNAHHQQEQQSYWPAPTFPYLPADLFPAHEC
uniref:Clr5 domain-containing protein n=1 Tax=Mycena chlorophos TaxID=658473 RepID=A0ABQ0M923_MYCCL|nr:predicted protein [Mycena chlorophos]